MLMCAPGARRPFPPRPLVLPGMYRRIVMQLALALAAAPLLLHAQAGVPEPARAERGEVEERLERIAARGGGRVGVAAIHLETGRRISLHGGERFPMASVYKLPIALQLLHR